MIMKRLVNPSEEQLAGFLERPQADSSSVVQLVQEVIERVRSQGDAALYDYEEKFDHVRLKSLIVTEAEIEQAVNLVPLELQTAIKRAAKNIASFHASQKHTEERMETEPGIACWRKNVPIRNIGLYIPGGSAPLFSTVLMLAIPAKIAGCEQIVLATPPGRDGCVHPAILYAASLCGVTQIVKLGGAQAIAALAYGTETIARMDKIFGPGNRFVTTAKQLVAANRCAIDLPAGPSEVMVVVDCLSNPAFAAADLLSQAEHGPDSQSILLVLAEETSRGEDFLDAVEDQISQQMVSSERRSLIESSLGYSRSIVLSNEDRVVEIINRYGPEHLIVNTEKPARIADKVYNAGSVFLGEWSPESAGDYASGTNHTLPTAGWAASYSGVSLDSFYKKITYQQLTYDALASLGPSIMTMAKAELLEAHAKAVSIRLEIGDKETIR